MSTRRAMIQLQRGYSHTTHWCLPHQEVTVVLKMLGSSVRAGVEQAGDRARLGIKDFDPIRLPQVAAGTGPGQIVQVRGAAAGAGHDMLDMKGRALQRLMHAA